MLKTHLDLLSTFLGFFFIMLLVCTRSNLDGEKLYYTHIEMKKWMSQLSRVDSPRVWNVGKTKEKMSLRKL